MTESGVPISFKSFALFGLALTLVTGLLALETLWEETILTGRDGPQMVGFTIAHIFPFILLAPLGLALWFLIALVIGLVAFIKRTCPPKLFWLSLLSSAIALGALLIPETFVRWAFAGYFVKTSHAADIVITDIADGHMRVVRADLDHGFQVNQRSIYGSSTAAHAAAASGRTVILELLTQQGADLNEVDSTGKSPLADAIDNNQKLASSYLVAHGAREIRPVEAPVPSASATVTVDGSER